ncbi:MAG: hypothetical protein ACFE8J_19630 [Candidatus Heimdallarchaeota archaeon]
MSDQENICESCGENPNDILYECSGGCDNPICDNCAIQCKKCGKLFCESCYHDHKKVCRK